MHWIAATARPVCRSARETVILPISRVPNAAPDDGVHARRAMAAQRSRRQSESCARWRVSAGQRRPAWLDPSWRASDARDPAVVPRRADATSAATWPRGDILGLSILVSSDQASEADGRRVSSAGIARTLPRWSPWPQAARISIERGWGSEGIPLAYIQDVGGPDEPLG